MGYPVASCRSHNPAQASSPPPPPPPSTLLDGIINAWKVEQVLTNSIGGGGALVSTNGTATYDNTAPVVDGYYAVLPTNTKLQLGTVTLPDSLSVSMWASLTNPASFDSIFSTQEIFCYVNAGGSIDVGYNSNPAGPGGGYTELADLFSVAAGTFFHLVITISITTGEVKVYVNGSEVGAGGEWIGNQSTPPEGDFFEFGNSDNGMKVDEMYIWNRALTSGEVAELSEPSFYPFA